MDETQEPKPKRPRKKHETVPHMLTPLQLRFVENFISGMNVTQSAIAAGYSPNSAHVKGSENLKIPRIRRMVEEARQQSTQILVERATYTAESAIRELDDAINFAKETSNAAAWVRAVETKAKVAGLLQDKSQSATAAFAINIVGLEPKAAPPMITVESLLK